MGERASGITVAACAVVCAVNALMWCGLFLHPELGVHSGPIGTRFFVATHIAGLWCSPVGSLVAVFADPSIKREATIWALPFFLVVGLLNLFGIFWGSGHVMM